LAAFALLTMLYTTAVCVLVSWGDFPRYRYEVDGLYWIFTVLGASLIVGHIARWQGGGCFSRLSPQRRRIFSAEGAEKETQRAQRILGLGSSKSLGR